VGGDIGSDDSMSSSSRKAYPFTITAPSLSVALYWQTQKIGLAYLLLSFLSSLWNLMGLQIQCGIILLMLELKMKGARKNAQDTDNFFVTVVYMEP
jgi:hypothetical protein